MSSKTDNLLQKFKNNYKHYKEKEIGDGTQDFCKSVFESEIFGLTAGDTNKSGKFRYEATRNNEGHRGDDFILNINGIIIPVEVEKLDNIQAGEHQIEEYMRRKNTLYGILTDGGSWKFYTQGYSASRPTLVISISDLLKDDGKEKIQRLFLKKTYYLNSFSSLSTLVSQSDFVLEEFHQDLIKLAEDVKYDFENAGAFSQNDTEPMKIKGVYSFIIQFILLKIIQDKKNKLDLLGIDRAKEFLENEEWNHLTKHIFQKLRWLADFYGSYKNEQETLLQKIRERYTDEDFPEYNIDALRPFLDLYVFVLKYNFSKVKQDIFGAVYENYLKELYKDDDTKKGQVFTPPDIVEFMLDEVGYDESYITKTIGDYGLEAIRSQLASPDINTQYLNIPGLSIIDPACGSGTFLYKAASRIVNAIHGLSLSPKEKGLLAESLIINNIVGFDIEAFPLYLAEMNILMALLYHNIDDTTGDILNKIDRQIRVFSTQDSIAEFSNSDISIKETVIHALDENLTFASTINEKRDEKEIFKIYLDIRDINPENIKEDIKCYYVLRKITTDLGDKHPIVAELLKKKTLGEYEHILLHENQKDDTNLRLQRIQIATNYKKYKTDIARIDNMVDELILKHETKRSKFDFVVGNPPYIYTDGDKTDIFGYDINDKKYTEILTKHKSYKEGLDFAYQKPSGTTSKFNLYGYFYYLGFYLLREHGKLIYITPRSLINKLSMYKLKIFLKKESTIEKILDFGNGSLFYDRGFKQSIVVGTDSCILQFRKEILTQNTELKIQKYIGPSGKITLADFEKNHRTDLIPYQDVFNTAIPESQEMFIDYFYDLQKKDKDFHYSILPGISIGTKKDLSNKECKGYPIYEQKGYYTGLSDLERYYDPDENGYEKVRPTCLGILDKKYRIVLNYFNRNHKVSYSDFRWIQNWGNWIAIGVNNEKYIPELYYIFGLLNSYKIAAYLEEEFDNTWSLTALKLCAVPKIDSELKGELKNDLINNSGRTINLAKGIQSIKNWRDILDIGLDGLDETVRGIKSGYEYMAEQIGDIQSLEKGASIPKDILKFLRENNPHMRQLETERDQIVEKLYNL